MPGKGRCDFEHYIYGPAMNNSSRLIPVDRDLVEAGSTL